eukprot:TRINITY_DN311_c0_g3_i1.p1 TRINITY_DN311_c0_g3~~TRINITY_DN311_c0_g3_i1.p1  ORF type:complete len:269 (+),score=46.81 TRINITY_DN311_c0_g3_i1:41-847(+)
MNPDPNTGETIVDDEAQKYYCSIMDILDKNNVPFLVGGTFAFGRYTGIARHTKDFDIFLKEKDMSAAFSALEKAGYRTDITFPHWLGKTFHPGGQHFIDLIFASGNRISRVDDVWFDHSVEETVLGRSCRLLPPEEIIWTKAFVQERERFDGADINHLLRSCAEKMNWDHLIKRFGPDWRVLLSHLVLFGYVYPELTDKVPKSVMDLLISRLQTEPSSSKEVCKGTRLSREQYLVDVQEWGYKDGRLDEMTPDQIASWTEAIKDKHLL